MINNYVKNKIFFVKTFDQFRHLNKAFLIIFYLRLDTVLLEILSRYQQRNAFTVFKSLGDSRLVGKIECIPTIVLSPLVYPNQIFLLFY